MVDTYGYSMSSGKKRFWSDDEKREICGQARVAGASVAQVARRYAINANLIRKWMRDPRFAAGAEDSDEVIEASFLPVEIADRGVPADEDARGQPPSSLCETHVDLSLSDGRRVLVEGPIALSAVVGLVEGLVL